MNKQAAFSPAQVSLRRSTLLFFATSVLLLMAIPPPGASAAPDLLHRFSLDVREDGSEFEVRMEAWSPGAAWDIRGREGAAIRLLIDGIYDQHVFVFAPSISRNAAFIIGPLLAGKHEVRMEWETSWSPVRSLRPRLGKLEVHNIDRKRTPLLRAPILHLREDTIGRFSDVPLLMYWESDPGNPSKVVYTVVFSNEDGGTNTERLMARWGRTTDIEWCYSYLEGDGMPGEEYQGPEHETLPFQGRKIGDHPVFWVATANNNFTDRSESKSEARVRLSPTPGALSGFARERVMDRFPWTYAVMSQEMIRENKIETPADPGSVRVSDLRNYAYLEVCAEQSGTELFFEIQIRGSNRWFTSHHVDPEARIGRSGCVRSTIELPRGTDARDLRALRIQCVQSPPSRGAEKEGEPRATIISVPRLFLLARNFLPGANLLDVALKKDLRPGDSVVVEIR